MDEKTKQKTDVRSQKPESESHTARRSPAPPGPRPDPDRALMKFILGRWGGAIAAACQSSTLPPEFLAALIANESAGRADACRYEPMVYGALVKVREGRRPRFGVFIREQLLDKTPSELRALATSWGLTQIMGYNAASKGVRVGFTGEEARAPETNLRLAVEMLSEFARRFRLDLARDFEALLHTWNTGSPDGRTFDPDYVTKGLGRMELYREIAGLRAREAGVGNGESGVGSEDTAPAGVSAASAARQPFAKSAETENAKPPNVEPQNAVPASEPRAFFVARRRRSDELISGGFPHESGTPRPRYLRPGESATFAGPNDFDLGRLDKEEEEEESGA